MIFYFSGTGNTKWAALYLADTTHEQLYYIPDELSTSCQYELKEDERIGFVFPVHGWRPPTLIRKFIERLTVNATSQINSEEAKQPYVYAVCTAGDTIGETIDILKKDLAKRNIILQSAFSLIMPESYVGLPLMDVENKDNERRKIEESKKLLKEFSNAILQKEEGLQKLTIGKWPKINSRLIGSFFVKYLITDKPFRVESSRCVKCGICADVCPVHDIIGGLGYEPQWKHDGSCLTCFTCYHHCPHHAIEFGNQTKHKGQYFYK